MLNLLYRAENLLPELLARESEWKSVFADSEKPHLSRLWRQWGENRIYVHFFSECDAREEFPHPHPWNMAVRILEGSYAMGSGYSNDINIVPKLTYQTFGPGDCYEITDPHIWHALRPIGAEVLTVMVAGPTIYPQNRIRSNKVARELTQEEQSNIFLRARARYPIV